MNAATLPRIASSPAPASVRLPTRGATIVIAAGGTGGHFFPAEALAAELMRRGHRIVLLTDSRSGALDSEVFRNAETHVLHGAGLANRGAVRGTQAALAMARGTVQARRLLGRLRPAVMVGFGGYPSVPPIIAARTLSPRPPVVLHEQNGVLGRANRLLSRFAGYLALGMPETTGLPSRALAVVTGNPIRPAVAALSGHEYKPPKDGEPIRLLVTGGSLGARVFSDAVPAAVALLPDCLSKRLRVVQQCRREDLERVRAAYAALGIEAELSAFFPDMADRLRDAHFIIARAGAGTVAEIAAVGRPALLVPLPGAIDGHQARNAEAVGALTLTQASFENEPAVLAEALAGMLGSPTTLAMRAQQIAAHGRPYAASALADLVEQLAQARSHGS